jgi:hypothetical protein
MMVSAFRKSSASIMPPTARPSRIVTTFASSFCAAFESRSRPVASRSRLPNIKVPMSGVALGAMSPVMTIVTIGNRIFVLFETFRARAGIFTWRSASVVSARMIGGWMIGTSAM